MRCSPDPLALSSWRRALHGGENKLSAGIDAGLGYTGRRYWRMHAFGEEDTNVLPSGSSCPFTPEPQKHCMTLNGAVMCPRWCSCWPRPEMFSPRDQAFLEDMRRSVDLLAMSCHVLDVIKFLNVCMRCEARAQGVRHVGYLLSVPLGVESATVTLLHFATEWHWHWGMNCMHSTLLQLLLQFPVCLNSGRRTLHSSRGWTSGATHPGRQSCVITSVWPIWRDVLLFAGACPVVSDTVSFSLRVRAQWRRWHARKSRRSVLSWML
jgi:hypothetical protein